MKKVFLFLFTAFTLTSYSQIELESILEGGVADARTLLQGYVEPFPTGFGNGINGGWYTTAKTHKLLGIDIAVIANGASVPSSAETFTFNNADYSNIKLEDSSISSAEIPTLFGSQKLDDRPLLTFTDDTGNSISTSSLPGSGLKESIGFNVVPSAMLQAGIGLFKNTDLIIRYIPEQNDTDYQFSTFGFGIKHDLKQWIPFVKRLPFDVSALVGWNDVKSKFFLDPEDEPSQALEFNTKTFIFQVLASKKLSIFTIYGGVGTTNYKTDVNMLGSYTTSASNTTYTDPISLKYDGSSMRANLGLSIKLLFLNIAAEYAVQEYDVFSVRAGFSIR
ncbi:hypothetical protein BW723_02075 [Polaribacter reichenbachii]|uniref:Uncharacterized protein n=1 Tax=Polaribacter reichenbachii TaxID=996801 RepID=A0A1B8TW00_9FLAO|nr:DUF6588 family protein [Polaribacter reichenbachii]APZ45153.1 hypothetical protein BW723_02075 [Polaribacter reichenbachii]AUC19015.1 hypothetical protein BTO17_10075 [Polaribacter reichenbachii]OBY63827.1 hypothetical protein LPB301_13625 [Polaribacter reichenbachii]